MSKFKYWAFLSYSHSDKRWGDWLHKGLEIYRVPRRLVGKESRDGVIPERVFPIFRDREELPVSADLGSNINRALGESRYLIVICSPRAAKSRWVAEEIREFKKLGGEDRILALIVDGEPNATDGKPGFSPDEECFPEPMRYRMGVGGTLSGERTEPIAADVRPDKDGKQNAKLKLLAGLLAVNFDELKQREQERRLRKTRRLVIAAFVLVGSFAALAVALFFKEREARVNEQRAETEKMAAEGARGETRQSLSQTDFLQAVRSIDSDKDYDALAQLARSLTYDPKNGAALCRLVTLLSYRSYPVQQTKLDQSDRLLSGGYSPDGKTILTTSATASAHLWDSRTGKLVAILDGHSTGLGRFDPQGRIILTADGSTILLWDARSGKSVGRPLEHTAAVVAAEFSSDGNKIVAGCFDNKASIWDTRTQRPLFPPLLHGGRVHRVSFSPDGRFVVVASDDSTMHFWDAGNGKALGEPISRTGLILSLQFSVDGTRLLTGSYDHKAQIWNIEKRKPVVECIGHEGSVEPAIFSRDGNTIATASQDKTARLWASDTGKQIFPSFRHDEPVSDVQFDQTGSRVATASWDKSARIWSAKSGEPLTEPLRHNGPVRSVEFSRDGRSVLTLGDEATARIWDIRITKMHATVLNHEDSVKCAWFSPDGRRIATVSFGKVRLWDASSGQPLSNPTRHDSHGVERAIQSLRFSPDGTRFVTTSDDQTARIWDGQSGAPVGVIVRHSNTVWSGEFSPDGKRFVTASMDKTARVWDSHTGAPLTPALEHANLVYSARFSPDGKRIVTASLDQTARVWNSQTGRPATEPLRHNKLVHFADFSGDGTRVVTASEEGARVWDAQTGKPVTAIFHPSSVIMAQFSPDNTLVATASHDRTARIWNAETGQPVTEPLRHANSVQWLQFSANGRRIVTASFDGTGRVWDVRSGKPLTDPLTHDNAHDQNGGLWTAQFSLDGSRIVTASNDHSARIWDIAPPQPDMPDWLPQLAEAVAGKHLNNQGVFEPISESQAAEIVAMVRNRLTAPGADNGWATWGRWFLSEPNERSLSPFSRLTLSEYIEGRVKRASEESFDEAELLAAGDTKTLARIADAEARARATPTPIPHPTTIPLADLEAKLIGKWQGPRHTVTYFPDHTFEQNGLYRPTMKWRLEGRRLIRNYPDLGEAITAWYPYPGDMSQEIVEMTDKRLITEFINEGKRIKYFEYRVFGNTQEEIEEAAGKAKLDRLKEEAISR